MESDTQLQKHSSLPVSVITRVEQNDQLISLKRFLSILMEASWEVICQGFVAAHTFS